MIQQNPLLSLIPGKFSVLGHIPGNNIHVSRAASVACKSFQCSFFTLQVLSQKQLLLLYPRH